MLMQADLEKIVRYFAEVVLEWTEVIPWVTCQDARDPGVLERACRMSMAEFSSLSRQGLV